MINKRDFRIKDNKKILHKVGKRWITISTLLLALIGGSALASKTVSHADNINNNTNNANQNSTAQSATSSAQSNIKFKTASNSTSSISTSANILHKSLVNNQVRHNLGKTAPTSTSTKNTNVSTANSPHSVGVPFDKPQVSIHRTLGAVEPSLKQNKNIKTDNISYYDANNPVQTFPAFNKSGIKGTSDTYIDQFINDFADKKCKLPSNYQITTSDYSDGMNIISDMPSNSTTNGINYGDVNIKLPITNIKHITNFNIINKDTNNISQKFTTGKTISTNDIHSYDQMIPEHYHYVNFQKINGAPSTLNFYISENPTGSITVHVIDKKNNKILRTKTLTGYIGTKVSLWHHGLTPKHYKYVSNTLSHRERYTKQSHTIDYFVRPIPIVSNYINYTYNGQTVGLGYKTSGYKNSSDNDFLAYNRKLSEGNYVNVPSGYYLTKSDVSNFENSISDNLLDTYGHINYNIPVKSTGDVSALAPFITSSTLTKMKQNSNDADSTLEAIQQNLHKDNSISQLWNDVHNSAFFAKHPKLNLLISAGINTSIAKPLNNAYVYSHNNSHISSAINDFQNAIDATGSSATDNYLASAYNTLNNDSSLHNIKGMDAVLNNIKALSNKGSVSDLSQSISHATMQSLINHRNDTVSILGVISRNMNNTATLSDLVADIKHSNGYGDLNGSGPYNYSDKNAITKINNILYLQPTKPAKHLLGASFGATQNPSASQEIKPSLENAFQTYHKNSHIQDAINDLISAITANSNSDVKSNLQKADKAVNDSSLNDMPGIQLVRQHLHYLGVQDPEQYILPGSVSDFISFATKNGIQNAVNHGDTSLAILNVIKNNIAKNNTPSQLLKDVSNIPQFSQFTKEHPTFVHAIEYQVANDKPLNDAYKYSHQRKSVQNAIPYATRVISDKTPSSIQNDLANLYNSLNDDLPLKNINGMNTLLGKLYTVSHSNPPVIKPAQPKPQPQNVIVTVHYVDENGHKIASDDNYKGVANSSFQFNFKTIPNYSIDYTKLGQDNLIKNAKFPTHNWTSTLVYRSLKPNTPKKPVTPNKPNKKPATPNKPAKPVTDQATDYVNYVNNGKVVTTGYKETGKKSNLDSDLLTFGSDFIAKKYDNLSSNYQVSDNTFKKYNDYFSAINNPNFGGTQLNIPVIKVNNSNNKPNTNKGNNNKKPVAPNKQVTKATDYVIYTDNGKQVGKTAFTSTGSTKSKDNAFKTFADNFGSDFVNSDQNELHKNAGLPDGYKLTQQTFSDFGSDFFNNSSFTRDYGQNIYKISVIPENSNGPDKKPANNKGNNKQPNKPQTEMGKIDVQFVEQLPNGQEKVLTPNNNLDKSDKSLHLDGNTVSDDGVVGQTHDKNGVAYDFDTILSPFMPNGYTVANQLQGAGLHGQYDLIPYILSPKTSQLHFESDGVGDQALEYMKNPQLIKIGVVPVQNAQITVNYINQDDGNKVAKSIVVRGEVGNNFDTIDYMNIPSGYELVNISNYPGQFTAKPQTVNIIYAKNAQIKSDVIKYTYNNQTWIAVSSKGKSTVSDSDALQFMSDFSAGKYDKLPSGYQMTKSTVKAINNTINTINDNNKVDYGDDSLTIPVSPTIHVNMVTKRHHKMLKHFDIAEPFHVSDYYQYVPSVYKYVNISYNKPQNILDVIVAKQIGKSNINVHYVADEGKGKANPIINTIKANGNVNDPFDATSYLSQIPAGYEYKRMSSVDRFTKRDQNVYIYLTPVNPPKLTISTITVNYKDGSQTVASRNISRPVSTEFTVNDCLDNLPSGYQYKGYRSNNIDHFDYNNHSVTVFVTKVPNRTPAESTITVNYVDNGRTVASSKTTADVSTDYDVGHHLNIPDGYVYKGMEGSTDDYHYNDQTVTVLVAKEPKAKVAKSTVTINYVDNGKVISSSKDTQPVSTDYDVYDHLSVPSGYIYKGIQNSNVNDFHYNDQVINVLVAKEPQRKVAKSTITVNYVNADTPNHQLIKKAGSDTENITTPFSIGSYLKNIPNGYKYVGINNNIDSFDYDNHTVDILLHKILPKPKVINSTITVDYIDTENNHVIKSTKSTEPEGTKFDSNDYKDEVPNSYNFVNIKDNTNSFAKNNQTVDIYVTPAKPSNSAKPSKSASAKPSSASAPASSSAQPASSSANKPMNSKSNSSQPSAHASASSANHALVPSSTASRSASASSASIEPTYKPSASHSTSHKSAQSIANHNASKSNNIIKPSSLAKGNSINTANHSVSIAHNYNVRVNRNTQSKLPQTNESSADNFMIASILLGIISAMLLSYGYDSKRKHI